MPPAPPGCGRHGDHGRAGRGAGRWRPAGGGRWRPRDWLVGDRHRPAVRPRPPTGCRCDPAPGIIAAAPPASTAPSGTSDRVAAASAACVCCACMPDCVRSFSSGRNHTMTNATAMTTAPRGTPRRSTSENPTRNGRASRRVEVVDERGVVQRLARPPPPPWSAARAPACWPGWPDGRVCTAAWNGGSPRPAEGRARSCRAAR